MNNGEKGAFACETNAKWNLGLTKREYMATAMLQGLIGKWHGEHIKEGVKRAIEAADELLKQLES